MTVEQRIVEALECGGDLRFIPCLDCYSLCVPAHNGQPEYEVEIPVAVVRGMVADASVRYADHNRTVVELWPPETWT